MRKPLFFLVLGLVGLTWQNWGRIDTFVFGHPQYSRVENQVFLYATEWCGYCQKTRELFRDNNISYVEYDIEKSEWARKEHKRLGGKGVPLVKVNGKVIHGYNPQLILASINSN